MKKSLKTRKAIAIIFIFSLVSIFATNNLSALVYHDNINNYDSITESKFHDKGSYTPTKVIRSEYGKDVFIEGTGSLNLGSFVSKNGMTTALSGGRGPFFNGGYELVRDRAVTMGGDGKYVTGHGGSFWKLYDRSGMRLGTYTFEGIRLRD